MSACTRPAGTSGDVWKARSFWDEVEECIEAADPLDLHEFATADRWPIEAPASFRDGLRIQLRALVRRRYCN
jgi:hypothetical protein